MLWHVSKTNLYLLGSIHVLDTPPPVSAETERAYSLAERVVFEARLDEMPDVASGFFSDGDSLSHTIPAPLFAAAKRWWLALGYPDAELERIRPWFAALRLMMGLLERHGFIGEHGVDKHFWHRAVADRRAISHLEATSSSLAPFAASPASEQQQFLSMIAEQTDMLASEFAIMIRGWREHQTTPILDVLNRRLRLIPCMFTQLVPERNQRWMPRLLELARDGIPTLAVLGVTHLVGPHGVPALFHEYDYDVLQIDRVA